MDEDKRDERAQVIIEASAAFAWDGFSEREKKLFMYVVSQMTLRELTPEGAWVPVNLIAEETGFTYEEIIHLAKRGLLTLSHNRIAVVVNRAILAFLMDHAEIWEKDKVSG